MISKQLNSNRSFLGHPREGSTAVPFPPRVAVEIEAFLAWFNAPLATDPVIKAALAHLWFVTIHPFEDGNGRIARAIADLALARSEGSSQRFYSMSAQIRAERNAYFCCGRVRVAAAARFMSSCCEGLGRDHRTR
jgi:Fic family protein